ncbi:MAG: S41 family peptidase [Blastocatellia bacterium]|nr:S41 family peptidase [Blastocatellia bacterium]
MNMKPALRLMTIVIAVSVSGISFAQQRPRSSATTGPAEKPTTATTRRPVRVAGEATQVIEKDFSEALKVIERHYVDGSKLDYNSAFKSSILGMLRSLDPHSNYYDRDEYEELKTDQRSEYFGIGASIQSYFFGADGDTFITATFQNSPAARAGLRFGDRIVAVDGVKMTGKPSLEVRDKIRGPRGSVVKVTIERAADRRLQTVEIARDVVPQPSIPDAYLIKPGVGYIDMTRGFNYSTTEELQDALEQLHARGMNSLVLDLRNNPGGFLDQAIHVAEVFLPNGQLILTQKGRNGLRDNTYRSANNAAEPVPLVILINQYTASASEIVAGAMQDHDRALIVGETSFGKGLVQSIIPLDYGAGLTLTSAKYYTPSGRLIQRDYADSGLYDYYTHGGSKRSDDSATAKIVGPEKKTDSGRPVYGGGGIAPDEAVGPRTVTVAQRRLLAAIFAFARELVNGRIPAPADYRVRGAINFEHELKPSDFVVTDSIVRAFKDFVAADPDFKNSVSLVDRNRAFVELHLRFNMVQSAYGRVMAERVFLATDDKQLARAVDVLPRARDLAMTATHHTQP